MSNETPRRQADARGFIDCDAPGPTGQAIVGGLSLDVVQPRVLRFAGRIRRADFITAGRCPSSLKVVLVPIRSWTPGLRRRCCDWRNQA